MAERGRHDGEEKKNKKDGLIQRQTKLPTLSAKGFLIQRTLMNK